MTLLLIRFCLSSTFELVLKLLQALNTASERGQPRNIVQTLTGTIILFMNYLCCFLKAFCCLANLLAKSRELARTCNKFNTVSDFDSAPPLMFD